MAVDRDHHLVHRQAKPACSGLDDADIGLMGDQPVQFRFIVAKTVQALLHALAQGGDRNLEYLTSPHGQVGAVQLIEVTPDATGKFQQLPMTAIGMNEAADDARLRRRLQDHGPRAITEQHTGPPVIPIHQLGHHLGAHHEHPPRVPGADELVGDIQGVDKAAASRFQGERPNAGNAQAFLQHGGAIGKDLVRGGGAHHDQIEVFRRQSRHGQRLPRGLFGHHADRFVRRADMALHDPRALANPGIAGVQTGFQVGIGEQLSRQIASCRDDP